MIEVDDEVYAKLLKDSNDNTSLLKIIKYGLIFVLLLLVLLIYGIKIIDISLTKYRTSVECQAAIIKAENRVRIREIESAGMSTEEYFKWIELTSVQKEE